jgi:Raf kinase inhibitor-like YbhB/YbcL family protein
VMSRNLVLAALMSLIVPMLPTHVVAQTSSLQIASTVIADGATIPTQFTCSGANQSPPLSYSGIPQNAKSLILLLEDPDAPGGTFVHWVVYDISPSSNGFQTGAANGKQGANSMGRAAYLGPCPPPGKPHHYHFRLFALDWTPALEARPAAPAVRGAMTGHVIQSAELVGIFGR